MHIVAKPYLPFLLFSSWTSFVIIIEPVAPTGCPKAIAPPLTFTISSSKPNSLLTAHACAANASFDSTKSKNTIERHDFLKAI